MIKKKFTLLILFFFSVTAQAAGVVTFKNGNKVGSVIAYSGTSCPFGTVLADGSSKLVSDYPTLGSVYGISSGSITLPNYKGKFLRGLDSSGAVDPDRGGAVVGSYQADQIRSHVHSFVDYVFAEINGGNWGFLGSNGNDYDNGPNANYVHDSEATGGSETRPKNVAVLYCLVVD